MDEEGSGGVANAEVLRWGPGVQIAEKARGLKPGEPWRGLGGEQDHRAIRGPRKQGRNFGPFLDAKGSRGKVLSRK